MNLSGDNVVEIVKVIGSIASTIGLPLVVWWIRRLEKNTNSIVSRLIASTEKTSEQAGKEKEQVAQKERDDARLS